MHPSMIVMSAPLHHCALRRGVTLAMLAVMLCFSKFAAAQEVIVKDAWARATAPGQKTAGIYLEIISSADAALVGVRSSVAKSAEIHATRMEGGVMKMRAIERLALPAGKPVKLAPGGLHIMLLGVARPLGERDTIPLELTVEGAGGVRSNVEAQAQVRATTAGAHHAH